MKPTFVTSAQKLVDSEGRIDQKIKAPDLGLLKGTEKSGAIHRPRGFVFLDSPHAVAAGRSSQIHTGFSLGPKNRNVRPSLSGETSVATTPFSDSEVKEIEAEADRILEAMKAVDTVRTTDPIVYRSYGRI